MSTVCGKLKGCPASQYFICPAYSGNKNCWETKDLPCCRRNDKERCFSCTLFIAHQNGITSNVYPMTLTSQG